MKISNAEKAAIRKYFAGQYKLRFKEDGTVLAQQQPGGAWGTLYSPWYTEQHLKWLREQKKAHVKRSTKPRKKKTKQAKRSNHVTHREALSHFNQQVKPHVIAKYGPRDRPALGEAWVLYVDGLERDGMISQRQAETWDNPFYR